jgi:hypothetical protein
MVGLLSFGKRQWEHLDAEMRTAIEPLYSSVDKLLPLIEADTAAFEEYVVSRISGSIFPKCIGRSTRDPFFGGQFQSYKTNVTDSHRNRLVRKCNLFLTGKKKK